MLFVRFIHIGATMKLIALVVMACVLSIAENTAVTAAVAVERAAGMYIGMNTVVNVLTLKRMGHFFFKT